jgi:lysophospholipase L1-like esterase
MPTTEAGRSTVKLTKRLVFGLVAVVAIFAAAELIVRLALPGLAARSETMQFANPHRDQPESFVRDPVLFWRLKPNNAVWEVNADGYRGPLRPVAKPAGVFRVCCLGDSCTFGLGSPPLDYSQTYAAVLEQLLTDRLKRPVEVLNFGCPGYTTYQGLRLLETVVLRYQPDAVTAYFGVNDGFPAIGYPDAQQKPIGEMPGWLGAFQSLLWRSATYRAAAGQAAQARRAAAPAEVFRVSGDEFRENAATMRRLGERHGFAVWFVPSFYLDESDRLSVIAESQVEPAAPLAAAFAAATDPKALFYPPPDRVHPTAEGHRVIAEVLAALVAAFAATK